MNQMNYGQPGQAPMSVAQMQGDGGSRFAPNLTQMDLSSVLGVNVQSSGGLLVQFFYYRVQFGGRTNPLKGKYETRLAVALQPRGDRLTVAIRNLSPEDAQRDFPAEWNTFKVYMDTPTTGTPLYELPGATQSMIGLLALHGIRSIEDMANVPTDICAQIGMDAQTASRLAKLWLGRKDGSVNDIELAEQLASTTSALQQAHEELRRLRADAEVKDRTLEAVKQMGMGHGQAPSPLGIPTGQVAARDDGTLYVDPKEYQNAAAEPAVDIFAAPRMVTGTEDLGDPLAEE